MILGIIYAFVTFCKDLKYTNFNFPDVSITIKDILIIAILSLIWSALAGVGGIFLQSTDWLGHSSKFYSLATSKWPLCFSNNNSPVIYYFGFYLAPALLTKYTNTSLLGFFIWIWTYLGFFIVSCYLYLLLRKKTIHFIFFTFIGGISTFLVWIGWQFNLFNSLLHDKINLYVMTIFEQSCWAPNQLIPVLIVSSILLITIQNRLSPSLLILPLATMIFWTVFPTLILIIIIAYYCIKEKYYLDLNHIKTVASKAIIPFITTIIPILIYYSSSQGGTVKGFIYQFGIPKVFTNYSFLIIDVICMQFLAHLLIKDANNKKWVAFINILILIAGLYRIGLYNDFFTRTAIVFKFFQIIPFFLDFEYLIENLKKHKIVYLVIIIFLIQPTFLLIPKLKTNIFTETDIRKIKFEKNLPFDEILRIYHSQIELKQYSCKPNSIYEHYLSP